MSDRICDHCGKSAMWRVMYFTDGSDSQYACGRHLSKAAALVASGATVPSRAPLRLIPLKS